MTHLDWFIVLALNAVVLVFGVFRSGRTRSSVDWFLGGRSLPFWIVGVSMFATNVDSGDYVAISGLTYSKGVSVFTVWWLGISVAYVLAAFLVVPPIYRSGLFTNAEYLESRFSPGTRIISAFVQLQYRTNILANITISLQLLLTLVVGIDPLSSWVFVVGFILVATSYAAWGGLKVIAWTDALLAVSMIVSTLVLWVSIWGAVGGWQGAVDRLELEGGEALPFQLLHIGASRPGEPHPLIIVAAWVIIASGYAVVNHTQVMKLFGARSLWDLKVSIAVASALTMLMMYFCGTLGILGRALWPEPLNRPDEIYPLLVREYLGTGIKGVVVAGVLAAAFSTYQGITSALSAVFTRDVYARLIVVGRKDSHYLMVSRLMMPAIALASLAYIPFILRFENMLSFLVRVTSVLVTPLLTVYLLGVSTRVHRKSATVGLVAGSVYGTIAVLGETNGWLPAWLVNQWTSYLWSLAITAVAMISATCVLPKRSQTAWPPAGARGWLLRAQDGVPRTLSSPFVGDIVPVWASPGLWAAVVVGISASLVFYFFW